jgi:diguanylate cyclase (GGDEF)-like protein
MAADPFLEEDFRVLTPEAFEFVLNNELKRAVRSQNFLTLVLVEPTIRGVAAGGNGERDLAVREIARLISRDVRETDLLSHTGHGQLSVVLLDADLQNSLRVIDRLMGRLEHYEFAQPLAITVGAASCPTHGADAESLRRAAEERPVHPRRDSRGNASNAQ